MCPSSLCVKTVARAVREPLLRNYFELFGTISKIKMVKNRFNGKYSGIAFIDFYDDDTANIVLRHDSKHAIDGVDVQVSRVSSDHMDAPRQSTVFLREDFVFRKQRVYCNHVRYNQPIPETPVINIKSSNQLLEKTESSPEISNGFRGFGVIKPKTVK